MPLRDKDLDKYYRDIASMCGSPGWKALMEQAKAMFDEYNAVTRVKDIDHLNLRKGQLDILNWIMRFKEVHEAAYEALEAEQDA